MVPVRRTYAWRLLGGFCTFVCLLAAFSWITFNGAKLLTHALDKMYQVHINSTVKLATANDSLWRLRYGFPQFLVLPEKDRQKILADEPQLNKTIQEVLEDYAALPLSEQERQQLQRLSQAYKRYMAARPHWFELIAQGKTDEAAEYRARTTTPFGRETVDAFVELIRLQQNSAKAETLALIEQASRWRTGAMVLTGVMLLLLLPMAWMTWLAMRGLRTAQRVAEQAAESLSNEKLEVHEGDELTTLISTVRLTTARFLSYTAELESARTLLKNQNDQMEQEVANRTAQLEDALASTATQAQQAARLAELNDRLQSCLNPAEAGAVIAAFAPALFGPLAGRLTLVNPSRNLLDSFTAWGEVSPANEASYLLEDCWALRRGVPHLSAARQQDIACKHIGGLHCLCIPIHNQEGAVGVLSLELGQQAAPGPDMLQLSGRIASQIGLALTNLRLREKLREQSIIDALTTLYNRRFFEECLGKALAHAERNSSSVALLVLDVDHFKRFNDSYGHETGDRVLSLVGQALKASIRPGDIACRYGGEEFVVVMPGASIKAAAARADELRVIIGHEAVDGSEGRFGSVTLSIGVAVYPTHGQTGTALFAKADQALYQAKRNGRNQIQVATVNAPAEPEPGPNSLTSP